MKLSTRKVVNRRAVSIGNVQAVYWKCPSWVHSTGLAKARERTCGKWNPYKVWG